MERKILGGSLAGLLGEENRLYAGQHTTLGDCRTRQELAQLFVVTNGGLKMTGDDSGLLVVASGVSSQLEDFSSEVLKHGGEVNGSTGTDTLGVFSFSDQTVDTTDRERSPARDERVLAFDFAFSPLSRLDVLID